MKQFRQNNAGLTLIEVLIALAILSIALTAIIRSTTQNIRNTAYLQNKMIATWVGTDIVNEIRAGLLKPLAAGDRLTQETTMLGQKWSWQATLNPTPNPKIKEIRVDVAKQPDEKKLVQLTSYVYVPAS